MKTRRNSSHLAELKQASEWLYEDDPEWVEGGCADMSGLLLDYATARGMRDVRLVVGMAARKKGAKKGFPHVWLEVAGEPFDPSIYAQGDKLGTYVEDAGAGRLAVEGSYLDQSCDVREDNEFRLDALLHGMGYAPSRDNPSDARHVRSSPHPQGGPMKIRRNTAAMPTDAEAKRRLQKLIDRLPLPAGANATVISARVRPYEYASDYHDEEGHTLEYEVGGHTDLDADSTLARYRDHDLHRIVSDALGVRRGDEDALLEDADVIRDRRALRDYPGFSVIWSGTILDRAAIHTDEGDTRADNLPEVRAGKRNAGFMQKLLTDTKTNPRARRVSTAVLGERVRVFRNLHTETWSVESATTGRIIAHPDTVLLEDVRLVSRDAGREEVRRTGRKNVHAIATGVLVALDGPAPADLDRWTPLYYNPFKVDTFVEFVGGKVGKPVRGARMWFAAADHRSQYALAPQEADPGRYKQPTTRHRKNGLLASLALVGIGMAAGAYVEEKKGIMGSVRNALKGKDKVAREQFARLKRGVLEAKPRSRVSPERAPTAPMTDRMWMRETSPDGKGYFHARTMNGEVYEVFERVYGDGGKSIFLEVGETAHARVRAPNGKEDGWTSVVEAKRAAEKMAGVRSRSSV